jgi:hypothetical protein
VQPCQAIGLEAFDPFVGVYIVKISDPSRVFDAVTCGQTPDNLKEILVPPGFFQESPIFVECVVEGNLGYRNKGRPIFHRAVEVALFFPFSCLLILRECVIFLPSNILAWTELG